MKKVIFLFTVIATAIIAVSCGHSDEPDPVKPDEITRVKDGNGKVFLENGVLVDANIDYTSAELCKALTEHEWYFDYGFYYDNSHVSPKKEFGGYWPTNIHVDGTIEYSKFPRQEGKIRDFSINGKELISTPRTEIHSGFAIPVEKYVIIALDLSDDGSSRMILDRQLSAAPIDGYDVHSSFARLIWHTIPND